MISLRISSNSSFFPFVRRVSGFLYLSNKDLTFSCSFLRTTVTFIWLYLLPIESNRLQLSFRAARARRARAPRGVAPPSSGGGTGPLCRPPPPALGTSQELIQFPFGLFAAVTVALLQLADEFFSIALDLVHIAVGELSPPNAV